MLTALVVLQAVSLAVLLAIYSQLKNPFQER